MSTSEIFASTSQIQYDPTFSPPLPYLPIQHSTIPDLRFTPSLPSDLPILVETLNSPLVYPHLVSTPYPYTQSDGLSWLKILANDTRDWLEGKRERMPFSAIRIGGGEGGEWVGAMGFVRWKFEEVDDVIERAKKVEENEAKIPGDDSIVWTIGYYLSPTHFGRGIASSALKTLLESYMIPILNCRTMNGIVHVGNFSSRRVLEKCGFLEIGQIVDPKGPGRGEGTMDCWVLQWRRL